jgi:membrane protein
MHGEHHGMSAEDTKAEADQQPELPDTPSHTSKRQWLHDEEERLVKEASHLAEMVKESGPGRLWARLNAVDFMTSSLQFAALAVLCLLPFLIVVAAETGRDVRSGLITRLGLDHAAAVRVDALMSRGTHAVAALTILGALFVLFGAIGIASTLQLWYQNVYAQQPRRQWLHQLVDRFIWLGGVLIYLGTQEFIAIQLAHTGARIPAYAASFGLAIIFYWWTIHTLLLGKVSWRDVFPAALATALCVTGLNVFSALFFSGQIVSSATDYGPIGVVMVILSYFIGFGVCIHLGAIIGRMWNERGMQITPDADEATPAAQ